MLINKDHKIVNVCFSVLKIKKPGIFWSYLILLLYGSALVALVCVCLLGGN